MTSRAAERAPAVLALACHLCAALLYALQRPGLELPRGWDYQYYSLLAASCAAMCYAGEGGESKRAKAAAAVSLAACAMASYPLPASSGVPAVLGMPLMVTLVLAFPRPDYLVFGAISIGLFLLLQGPMVAWGRTRPGAGTPARIALGATLAFALVLGALLKELAEARRRTMREAERLDSAIDRIADVNASFQSALAAAEASSSKGERNRITREIHDIVGYALTNQQMMLEAALMLVEPGSGRLRELLSMAKDGVAEGLRETRKTLYELRRIEEAPELDSAILLKLARNFESVTGIRVSVDFTNAQLGDLGHAAWLSLYRLVQESMINAFRHGKAANIAIIFREDSGSVYVLVRDDGTGASELVEGIGIKGMRERLERLGGELDVGNAVDGFAVSARLPRSPLGRPPRGRGGIA